MLSCQDNTEPSPFSETSVSKMNFQVKLQYLNTGAVVNAIFCVSKATRCSEIQTNVSFVNSSFYNVVNSFLTFSFLLLFFLTFVGPIK